MSDERRQKLNLLDFPWETTRTKQHKPISATIAPLTGPATPRVVAVVMKPTVDTKLGLGVAYQESSLRTIITEVHPCSVFQDTPLRVGMVIEAVNGTRYRTYEECLALMKEAVGHLVVVAFFPVPGSVMASSPSPSGAVAMAGQTVPQGKATRNDELWDLRYKKLAEFHETHGHCKVPQNRDKELCTWMKNQREAHRKNNLSEERRQKLNLLGFQFRASKEQEWNKRYEQLADFRKANGHCNVPLTQNEKA